MALKRPPKKPKLSCRFYRTDSGNEPVREWFKELEPDVRKEIGSDIQVVQWRWPVAKPLVDGFGEGLFEIRTSVASNTYRVLFCIDGSTPRASACLHEEGPEDSEGGLRPRPKAASRSGERPMKKKHVGSTLDSLLDDLREKEEVGLLTQKKLLAAKVEQAMAKRQMTKKGLAEAMHTSRTVVHRLLDPKDTGVTLATLWKASRALGVKLVQVG